MKKFFLIQVFIAAAIVTGWTQLKVSSNGNVGIKLPNTTDTPLSALSVGGTGSSSYSAYITGNSKNTALYVNSPDPYISYTPGYGIYSTITGNFTGSFGAIGIWGRSTMGSSYSAAGYGLGVVGVAGGYYRSYGVSGGLSSSGANGAGILGSTSDAIVVTPAGATYAGYFYGNIAVTGTINGVYISNSDELYKQNIETLDRKSAFNNLLSLRPVSYNLKQRYLDAFEDGKTKPVPLYDEKSDLFQKKHYGLVAQEVQKLYPDLVYTNNEGHLALNYTGLIPVLIESIQTLNEKIERLENNGSLLRSTEQTTGISGIENDVQPAALYQNAPNPFSQATAIKYYLPESVKAASLNIYNLQGKQLKQIVLAQRGEGTQLISGSEFEAGIYLYALIADAKEVDMKRMILTE